MSKLITGIWFSCLMLIGVCSNEQTEKEIIYVGTHGEGLHVFEFDRDSGQINNLQIVSDRARPGFQAIHPEGNYLYSVSGDPYSEGKKHGTISSYQIDPDTGMIDLINEQSVEGRSPAHVSIDPKGRFAYVSNFGSGNLSVFAINSDGSVTKAVDVVQHEGSSIDDRRQTGPHVHAIDPSSDGRYIYVSDMGIDKIMIYEVDKKTGELNPAEMPHVVSSPGAGPRHFTIHPNGEIAYSLEQMGSAVTVYLVVKNTGGLIPIQRISMLPNDFEGENQAADIHISSDEKFLYASNRGHDSLVIYQIDESTGELLLVEYESTRGSHPRNFMIDQKGEFVFVANRDDDNVVVFRRNKRTGKLSYSGKQIHVPNAVCVTQHILN